MSDSLSVLSDNWALVLVILLIILSGQIVIQIAIKRIFGKALTKDEYFSLGIGGWLVPALLVSLLWFLWGIIATRPPGVLIAFMLIFAFAWGLILFFRSEKEAFSTSKIILFVLFTMLGLSIFLRLAFVSEAILPLYSDSAQHYRIIKDLLGNPEASNVTAAFKWPTPAYYHLGFHLLAAFVTSMTNTEIAKTMLVLGQMMVAVTPLSIFFLIKHASGSNSAGIFAVLLATVGWYMPAYAANWGKYPALSSLMLIQFVLSVAYLVIQSRELLSKWKTWMLYAILASGILISALVHSRSLIVIGIAALSWILAGWWRNLPSLPRVIIFSLVLVGLVLEIMFVQTQDVLHLLLDPYGVKGLLVTALILFLSIFAQKAYPQLTFATILATALLICAIFIPMLPFIPGFFNLTLLDRPFVEMTLYMPLSLLGGLGLAGLQRYLQHRQESSGNFRISWRQTASVLCIGLLLINALSQYELYPSDCCAIAGADDVLAIDWIDKNLPSNARILVSAVDLVVLASGTAQGYLSGDAGAWITPLTDRVTVPRPFFSDFNQPEVLDDLCKLDIHYIYVGEMGQAFDASRLIAHPEWYKPLLSMPKAGVYQIIGCD
ncbi:MAG: hypothetical protein M3R47_00940 [Chloroflexota bacterium]|nr:hypothetical protein [Chloroflexota bacterium]